MSIRQLTRRTRRPAPARPWIVDVTNHWQVRPEGPRRGVTLQHPDGTTEARYLADDHPALVRYLERLATAA